MRQGRFLATADELRALLEGAGLRPTSQRVALSARLFGGAHRHVTAQQLHAEVCEDGKPVAVATVYNTLRQMVEAGLLREIAVAPNVGTFDTRVEAHGHFLHVDTGELSDFCLSTMSMDLQLPDDVDVLGLDVVVQVAGARAR